MDTPRLCEASIKGTSQTTNKAPLPLVNAFPLPAPFSFVTLISSETFPVVIPNCQRCATLKSHVKTCIERVSPFSSLRGRPDSTRV
jgi:hypothetical protein